MLGTTDNIETRKIWLSMKGGPSTWPSVKEKNEVLLEAQGLDE